MQNDNVRKTIEKFTETIPPTIDIIGYGSAVKTQTGYEPKNKKQIDIIATVKDSLTWHINNKELNPKQYNRLAFIMLKPLLHIGTDIEYVSDIPFDDNYFKIGVIDKFDFINDLNCWSNFYMAGRTQKPIMLVKSDDEIEKAIARNRLNALRVSLIINHDITCNEKTLFETLCSLSYLGDVRMSFKMENPHKINNIVNGEFEEFQTIYSKVNDDLYTVEDDKVIPNLPKLISEVNDLPRYLLNYFKENNIDIDNLTIDELYILKEYILKYLKKINLKSSICQPLKSAAINNIPNSIEYVKAKRKKYVENKEKKQV